MKSLIIFQITFILTISVDWYQTKSCKTNISNDWFKGRGLIRRPQSRVLYIHRGSDGYVITTGRDKNKAVTVPNCGKIIGLFRNRIVGGADAEAGQFPWVVLIQTNGIPFCGATILNERWIITAAHCFRDRKTADGLTIRVGSINSKEGTVYRVARLTIHEKYNNDGMENSDLALLKTASVIKSERKGATNLVNGVCLPQQKEEPNGNKIIVSGWGRTGENSESSRILKYVKLDVLDATDCARRFKIPMEGFPNGYNIYRSQLCAYTKKKDACQGDSGGPAIEYQNNRAVLIGVVSFGVGCASDFPGVYTKVSHFLDWIASHMD